jgi:putative hydrolase of the HAD superfamily
MFEAVFSIESVHFRPKPDAYGFLRLCRAHHLRPRRCIMVEDSLENLRTAKRLGMKTVWVSRAKRAPGYVDARVAGIAGISRHATILY